ncbi:homoserine acetyltransferase family protein [Gymnopus androsaceus JB14]|uniref:Homoserine acetyltransferase family protein n=1 Tax=Gymnopus androsaceus JB14 TaxID=1447944 RepID=A0A6A4I400_9AGAR|nr:homoserine acetyltransferase family protein [Gymnopus androsaceus JB14]
MSSSEGVLKYRLGNWELQSGQVIPNAEIAYKTFGDASSPSIIYPTWFSGAIADNEWLIGDDKALNPQKYYIIIPALFGNAQHKLVTEHLGITHARAVLGWSMAASQAYQWVTQYPDFVDLAIPFCGAAKVSIHNTVFLESLKGALLAVKKQCTAGACKGGFLAPGEYRTWSAEEKDVGLKAFGRVYAGWGFSQTFYRQKIYESVLGFKGLEDFLVNFWEKWATSKDPENLLAMVYTWQAADCSKQEPYNGDFRAAMQAIKAKMLVLPGKTDLYFPPEDSEIEVENMREGVGKMMVIPSVWGHWAGGPGGSLEDVQWLDERLREFGLGDVQGIDEQLKELSLRPLPKSKL